MISTSRTTNSAPEETHRTGLDSWTPLGFHSTLLAGAETQRTALTRAIRESADPQHGSPVQIAAWTGDHWGSVDLHHDGRLTWLCRSLSQEAWRYLEALGHDPEGLELHIARAWGVISKPGQSVSAHAHHESDLTAVYYVDVPENSGAIRFLNTASGGQAVVEPKNGQLVIFPSKQRHEVLTNDTDADRLSISFELTISRCAEGCSCDRATTRSGPLARRLTRETSTRRAYGVDGSMPCGLPAEQHLTLSMATAVAELRERVEEVGVDPDLVELTQPSLSWRREDKRSLFGKPTTDLALYIRIDGGSEECVVEYEGDPSPVALDHDELIVINGSRRHRIVGDGIVVRIGCDLPPASLLPLDRAEIVSLLSLDLSGVIVGGTRSGRDGHGRNLFPVR